MTALKDYVKVNNKFKNAINLYLDLNKIEKINSYIPTKSSVDILEIFLKSIEENEQQATLLIGPYGKGKSHLLLVLLAILSLERTEKNKEIVLDVVDKVKNVNARTAKRIERIFNRKGKFLPVTIMSTTGDLNQAFMVGIFEALKREGLNNLAPQTFFSYAIETIDRWKNDYPKTYNAYKKELNSAGVSANELINNLKNCDDNSLDIFKNIYPNLTSGSEFNPLVNSEVLPMYKNIADKLVEEYGYSGIYIIFDEFSKYIEGQDSKSTGNNMKLLQDICELANSSKESQVFINMVAHKSIKEYGKYLSSETINSFTGIEGRVKEIFFITSSKNNYELIGNAINKDIDKLERIDKVKSYFNAEEKKYSMMSAFSSFFTRKDFNDLVVKGCYPLSSISAYLLLNISEKVAQNERTLFTFISKDEQFSMANHINNLSENDNWLINANLIYDYFKDIFKKDAKNEFIHNEWLNAEYALSFAESDDEINLLKTLAIINIVNKPDEIPANIICLGYAAGIDDTATTINELENKNLIYKKNSTGCYVFKTRATSEIKTEIKKRKALYSDKVDIAKVLSYLSETKYVLPKRYNYQYTMTRFFNYEFMDIKDFISIPNLNYVIDEGAFCDGKILALFTTSQTDYEGDVIKKIIDKCPPNLVVIIGNDPLELEDKIREYAIIQELKNDQLYFKDNKILLKELPLIEEDLERAIYDYIENTFSEGSNKTVFYISDGVLKRSTERSLSLIIDEICFQLYNKTVSINNELINKEIIRTAPIKKVRKNLIDKLLEKEDFNEYMQGTSADATIFRALFIRTGILSEPVSYSKNVCEMLIVFNNFIDSAGNCRQSMNTLIDKLTSSPIGMRKGVIPIYFAYVISCRREDIIVYFGEKEIPLSVDILINMCETPDDYSIYISLEDLNKEKYLIDLSKMFLVKESVSYSETRISNIIKAMQRWFRSLPQITKNIKKQPNYFNDRQLEKSFLGFKSIMQKIDVNPFEILFLKLPEIFKSGEDYNLLAERLLLLKNKLTDYYDWVLETVIKETISVFNGNESESLNHTLREWYDKQSDLAKNGLQSTKVSSLMSCIADNKSFDDKAIIEKIVKATMEIYLDSWNDNTLEQYLKTIKSIKNETENINNDDKNGRLELSFIGKHGKKIIKYYEPVDEDTGFIMRNIISDTLEDFTDMSVNDKIAILLEMIENQLQ